MLKRSSTTLGKTGAGSGSSSMVKEEEDEPRIKQTASSNEKRARLALIKEI